MNGSTPDHPKGVYLDHLEPDGGTGKSIGREVVSLIRSKGIVESLNGVRTDGTATMTGIHTGAIRVIEEELVVPLQHMQCLCHILELPYRTVRIKLDGTTTGPNSFDGPIGKKCQEDVWKMKVVRFKPVHSTTVNFPEDVLKELSRDLKLLALLSNIVSTGIVNDKVVTSVIGPLCHSRWNTDCARVLRVYISTQKPSVAMKKLVNFIQCVYVPSWIHTKCNPGCQDGAPNFFYSMKLLKNVSKELQDLAKPVY